MLMGLKVVFGFFCIDGDKCTTNVVLPAGSTGV